LKAALDNHVTYYKSGANDGKTAGTDEGHVRKDNIEDGCQSRKDGCLSRRNEGLAKRYRPTQRR
jgi:hypothetical protein